MLDDQIIPKGWHALYYEAFDASVILNIEIKTTGIEKGLFRISGKAINSTGDEQLRNKLFKRICDSIASSSAKICMKCGAHGLRRKLEPEWPCLCSKCYLDYTNKKEE